ncbi:hypothetical protein D3C80_1453240 [compost metagenome]
MPAVKPSMICPKVSAIAIPLSVDGPLTCIHNAAFPEEIRINLVAPFLGMSGLPFKALFHLHIQIFSEVLLQAVP